MSIFSALLGIKSTAPAALAPATTPPAAHAPSRFDACFRFVLREEGGYVNNPRDPGGATNWGVTLKVLSEYRGHTCTVQDVKNLPVSEAEAIYKKNYWDKVRGDDLPAGVDIIMFDSAVNSGVSQASKWLQRAVGASEDGVVGNGTIAKLAGLNAKVVALNICDMRLAMLKNLRTWPEFGRGWSRRVTELRAKV